MHLQSSLKHPGNTDLTWYHRIDSVSVSKSGKGSEIYGSLAKVPGCKGGKLVLTMDAFQLLPVLGLEPWPLR